MATLPDCCPPEVSDQRNYLYAVLTKTTEGTNSGASFLTWSGDTVLTAGATSAILWRRA